MDSRPSISEYCYRCEIFSLCRECNLAKRTAFIKNHVSHVTSFEIEDIESAIKGAQMLPVIVGPVQALRQEIPCMRCKRVHYKPVVYMKHGYAICTACAKGTSRGEVKN
jgi:hypothetical protein